MFKIIIASQNPSKIEAVRLGFAQFFPDEAFFVEGASSNSGVSDQPMNDEETFQGALNRCLDIKNRFPEADFWIGIEGGVDTRYGNMEAFAWVIVLAQGESTQGMARTASFFLPPRIQQLIDAGYELGAADDLVFQRKNSKHDQGATGILTHGVIDRANYYAHAVVLAMIPFKNSELYQKI
ncbi:MAG: inosine/xanthosine triphosphatase [Microscillaceae bacterium]|nr:inosine/xanthosine triphosphatase [Microscillaceae bacterium]